jgi:hypothetical protein
MADTKAVIRPPKFAVACLTEKFTERTAGIWLPLVFYVAGGVYMLGFWGIFSRSAYHLVFLGVLSIIIAVALYSMSRWAFWLGLFTFPLLFTEFVYALLVSVNFAGWDSNPQTAAFNASLVIYLLFLSLSLILLIDKRNTLKGDRILDRLNRPVPTPKTSAKSD